jgi:hypothetical protein
MLERLGLGGDGDEIEAFQVTSLGGGSKAFLPNGNVPNLSF